MSGKSLKQSDSTNPQPFAAICDSVAQHLKQSGYDNCRLVVGVSGGADSIALLRCLAALRSELPLQLHTVHVNHQLRGDESDDDARFVIDASNELSIDGRMISVETNALAQKQGDGIEAAARELRYAAFQSVAEEVGAAAVLLAHSRDDQIETVLHHFLRGTGLRGLTGIPPVRQLTQSISIVRPMLGISRAQILDALKSLNATYRTDSSNSDPRFTRNRVRNELIPMLKQDYQPNLEPLIDSLARQARETQEAIEEICDQSLNEAIVENSADSCRMNREPLMQLPLHLQRECFRLIWSRNGWPRQRMGFDEWNRVATSLQSRTDWDLPDGMRIEHRGMLVHVFRKVVRN